jgi:hypothetical protein
MYQGCSGNGVVLACLFTKDAATGAAAGTLKVLDATTLLPSWGSAGTTGSYNPVASASADGQVPVMFATGSLSAGDNSYYVLYDAAGGAQAKVRLTGSGSDFGMTPISTSYGVVSQTNGVLTLINLQSWKSAGVLKLSEPGTGNPIKLVSPSSGGAGILYAVGYAANSKTGWLFSLGVSPTTGTLVVNSSTAFPGVSGASPVVVLPSASGLAENLVLLPTPSLPGQPVGQAYLAAYADVAGTGLQLAWSIPVSASLLVSPGVDAASGSLFYTVPDSPYLYQASLANGASIASFNLQSIGRFSNQFQLSGHVGVSDSGATVTILLGAIVSSRGQPNTQYAIAFQPIANPTGLLWSAELDTTTAPIGSNQVTPTVYTAAWNLAPATQPGADCAVVVSVEGGGNSSIVRICDH